MLVRHLATGVIGFKSITLELSTRLGIFLKSVSPVSMYFHDVSWNPRSSKEVGPKKYQVPWPGKSTSATPPCRRPGHTLHPVWSGCLFESSPEKVREIRRFEGMPVPKQCENVCFYMLLAVFVRKVMFWVTHTTKSNKTIQPFAEICSKSLLLVGPCFATWTASCPRLSWSFGLCIKSYDLAKLPGIADFTMLTYPFCGVLKKEHLWYNRNLGKSSLWNPEQNFLSCRHGFVLFGTEQSGLWRVGVGDKSAIRVNALSKSCIWDQCSDLRRR